MTPAILISLLGLIVGSYTDLRTREVPDWINYGLMFSGFGIALLMSTIERNIMYLVYSGLGFGVLWLVALAMYYTGQWGGGDSKMIMGIGALMGLNFAEFQTGLPFVIAFMIYTIFIGALYGLIWSTALAIKHRQKFVAEFKKMLSLKISVLIKKVLLITAASAIVASFFLPGIYKAMALTMTIIAVFSFYTFAFIKAIEKSCMLKYIAPQNLTEGDWIAEEVKYEGKVLAGPKDLGIEKKQIEHLIKLEKKGKIKRVLVKEGVPFVPSFLIAFIITLLYGSSLFTKFF